MSRQKSSCCWISHHYSALSPFESSTLPTWSFLGRDLNIFAGMFYKSSLCNLFKINCILNFLWCWLISHCYVYGLLRLMQVLYLYKFKFLEKQQPLKNDKKELLSLLRYWNSISINYFLHFSALILSTYMNKNVSMNLCKFYLSPFPWSSKKTFGLEASSIWPWL